MEPVLCACVCVWWTGNRYEGQWVDNLRSGQGVLFYADGGKYEGYFKNDKMNGERA
jgi:hypothetical protein